MLELKYFDKIRGYEQAEAEGGEQYPPFDVNDMGTDSDYKSAVRAWIRLFLLSASWLMRTVWPVYRFGRLIIVNRYDDVVAVLRNREDFRVPFGPEMTKITGGVNFALGMDGAEHDAQRAIMDAAMPPERRAADLQQILSRTRYYTERLLDGSGGRIDVMRDLLGRVFTETADEYFGLDLEDPNAFLDRSFAISNLIFADPLGNPVARRTALSAAIRVRYLIDRAIDKAERRFAQSGPQDRTILDRLVAARHVRGGTPGKEEIRAITIGTLTGLIPTNSLAAGKILEELRRRPRALAEAIALAAACENPTLAADREVNRRKLFNILLEAARLNPALLPGVWRHAPKDTTIAGRRVRGGSVVLVGLMSALRDGRAFERAGEFWPERPGNDRAWLMFGTESHECLGIWVAMEQITEIFQVLLARPGIGFSRERTGWLSYLGAFPRRLDMEFDTVVAPRKQTLITIQSRLLPDATLEEVQAKIAALGNPARRDSPLGQALGETGLVHFASLSAFHAQPDDRGGGSDPRLVLELNVDGDGESALRLVADRTEPYLADIFRLAEHGDGAFHDVLVRNRIRLSFLPWEVTGLEFNGTPDCPVTDIEMQEKVADAARGFLDRFVRTQGGPGMRPMRALAHVRRAIRRHPDKRLRDSLIRPSRRRLAISEWAGGTTAGLQAVLTSKAATHARWLVFLLVACQAAMIYQFVRPHVAAQVIAFGSLFGAVVLLCAGFARDGFVRLLNVIAYARRALPYPMIGMGLLAAAAAVGAVAWLNAWIIGFVLEAILPWIWPELRCVIVVVAGIAMLRPEYLAGVAFLDNWRSALGRSRTVVLIAVAAFAAYVAYRLIADPGLRPDIGQAPVWLKGALFQSLAALKLDAAFVDEALQVLGWMLFSVATGIASTIVGLGILAGAGLGLLRFYESRDAVDERSAPLGNLREIARRENAPGYAQNHIVAVTPLKEGWFRRVTLAVALWGIAKLVTYWYRPGFVLNMGTIHYARWLRLPGANTMVFFSNYDGSWESYLEDFVTKAHKGQTAAWSNGKGFPSTRFLILDGASDGSRFKRWVRRQQRPSLFWYSRFPHLTTDQIRTNAMIHDGLMRARTDTAAQAWLDCFGTMQLPATTIEAEHVQSLVFKGYPMLEHTICAAIALPDMSSAVGRRKVHDWLAMLGDAVTFGELSRPGEEPTFVGFSAAGIARILDPNGIADDAEALMSSFPPAFRMGMGSRGGVLRDTGASAPPEWRWTDAPGIAREERAVDAMLFVYGGSEADCAAALDRHRQALGPECLLFTIGTQPTAKSRQSGGKAFYEHFGFRDGISQPVIRGTQRSAKDATTLDLVEPGEMILGYRGNSGYAAPPITLPAEMDRRNDLAVAVPESETGWRFPRFRVARSSDLRDFGRNGTFVAVRQMEQHVERFDDFVCRQADLLNSQYRNLEAIVGQKASPDWIAAKMMGRWKDGRPLARRGGGRPGRTASSDHNDFNFGVDDPQGLQCPFGAHIRRANPRGGMQPDDPIETEIIKRHRILRRGRAYETSDGSEKGMMFVAICADLERQFEFLQQSWISAPSFQGLQNEPDPVVSTAESPEKNVFTIPTTVGPVTLKNMESFVTIRGGGYFFMPSRAALRYMASATR